MQISPQLYIMDHIPYLNNNTMTYGIKIKWRKPPMNPINCCKCIQGLVSLQNKWLYYSFQTLSSFSCQILLFLRVETATFLDVFQKFLYQQILLWQRRHGEDMINQPWLKNCNENELTSQNLAPIWFPHCPAWRCTISRILVSFL